MILELGKQFRPSTSIVYPPFKNGRYMEEYFYDYIINNIDKFTVNDYVYIPVFWTNLQVSDDFELKKEYYTTILLDLYNNYNKQTKFFTIVQQDDCIFLPLPTNTLIFGACSGHIPLPLIYEDINHTLANYKNTIICEKPLLCSFIGSETHKVRQSIKYLQSSPHFLINSKGWDVNVKPSDAINFINVTLQSKFALAPRGYGRSSFRYFECIHLGIVPIYVYDDINWLPYQDEIDYSKFSIVIHEDEISNLENLLLSIDINKYNEMRKEVIKNEHFFSLEYMSEYIIKKLNDNNNYKLYKGNHNVNFIE